MKVQAILSCGRVVPANLVQNDSAYCLAHHANETVAGYADGLRWDCNECSAHGQYGLRRAVCRRAAYRHSLATGHAYKLTEPLGRVVWDMPAAQPVQNLF